MERPYTPIDLHAGRLLRDLLAQARDLRGEIALASGRLRKLRADYESLRDLAATLTLEGESPIPPLD